MMMSVLPKFQNKSDSDCLNREDRHTKIKKSPSVSPSSNFLQGEEEISNQGTNGNEAVLLLNKRFKMKSIKSKRKTDNLGEGACNRGHDNRDEEKNPNPHNDQVRGSYCENCENYENYCHNFLATGVCFNKDLGNDRQQQRFHEWSVGSDRHVEGEIGCSGRCRFTNENDHTHHAPLNKEIQAFSQDNISARTDDAVTDADENSHHIICSVKDDEDQCDKKLSRRGAARGIHNNTSKIRLTTIISSSSQPQSKSESKQNNDNEASWSEPSYFIAVDDDVGVCDGRDILMESGIPATHTSPQNLTRTSQFTNNAIIDRKSGRDIVSPTSKHVIYTAGTVNKSLLNYKNNYYNETRRSKSVNFNSRAAHSISPLSRVPLLFNFILFSTFLLSGFNYCNVVQAEILSNLGNPHPHQQSNYVGGDELSFNATSATDHLSPLPYHHEHHRSINSAFQNNNSNSHVNYSSLSPASGIKVGEISAETEGLTGTTESVTKRRREEQLRELLSKPLDDSLDKNALIKVLWESLTPDEIHRIFGRPHPSQQSASDLNTVPNFDITFPKVTIHPDHERRKRRSASSSSSPQPNPEEVADSSEKQIELTGLGRKFTLNIYPNQELLDPYFVHLHRHQNRSEIIRPELAQKQLPCFFHGRTTHVGESKNDLESGAVAISLCGGLKGFILPTSNHDSGQQYHYVIHPLPDRLSKSVPAVKSPDRGDNDTRDNDRSKSSTHSHEGHEAHHRHHIIFRRQGTLFPNILPQSSLKFSRANQNGKDDDGKSKPNNNNNGGKLANSDGEDDGSFDKLPTCMHHDTKAPAFTKYTPKNNEDHDHVMVGAVVTAEEQHPISNNNELDLSISSKPNEVHRMTPIISLDLGSESGINDLESLTEEGRMRLLSSPTSINNPNYVDVTNMGTGQHFRPAHARQKRNAFDAETIDPFTYKPINAPDSYWLQFRDRGGSHNHGGSGTHRSSPITSDGIGGYNGNRRISSQFSYDEITGPGQARFSTSSGPSTSFQPSFWHHQTYPTPSYQRSSQLSHNLPSRPARGSRYDEIQTTGSDSIDDTGTAGSDHMTWSKGILVFDSSDSDEDRHYPGKDVPFYTKNNGNKRKTKGISTSSTIVSRTSSTSSSGGNTRSFDWFGGGLSDTLPSGSITSSGSPWSSLDKNRTTSKSYSSSSSSDSTSNIRKGRRDDGVFGDKWKSALDSDIIWADRSNEINKQSRFNDLANVKDRPHSHLTIETAVFVDKDLYKHMQQNFPDDTMGEVTRIVLAMINAVQLLYQDPSLGHRVDFVLKRLEVLETDPPTLIRPYDIDRFLTNFCKWQKTENPASDADPLHWDHALILTGLDLYVVHQSGKISNQVVGLAPVAGMCTRSSSCTVNEGRHFESVFVVAHEIGHNLGMRHDGPQAENNCDPTSHIMSPTLGSGKITWSPCSKKYLDLFLETSQAKCLFDKAKPERWLDHNGNGKLPGERFDADRQCVLKYGRGSFHATQQPLEDVCRDLHCRREFFTWTSHPALDGTSCSASDDMWCRAGKCVPKIAGPSSSSQNSYEISSVGHGSHNDAFSGSSNHLPGSETAAYATQKALDGGWGKWSPFTDCSSACLYSDDGTLTMGSNGVRLAARRCDSPRPENGGRQCSGPDRRYKTCAANKICTKTPTRTTVSQYANEVCSRAGQVDTELSGRGYMSSSNDPERACSVWCETNDNNGPRSRGWSFPDGTSCKLASLQKNAQAFCVAGKCQEFSCNPYSHFRMSEDDCAFTSSNDVIPNLKKSSSNTNSNNAADRADNWFGSGGPNGGVKINHRSGKAGWSDWEPQSECKLPCLAPAKGLQLVKRQCSSDDALCTGLSLSVRLCKPDKYAVQSNGCSRLQTPFEYATKVCSKYAEKVSGLSGIGMQLSPTKDDSDRPCRIGCQDASIAYRFYMVNGEEGWFPAGTDCSRGDQEKKAYCMAGKCVDFGDDDTPLYQINSNMMGSLFQQQRSKRQAVYNIMEPLKTEPGMDQSSLKKLVQKFSQETGNYPSIIQRSRASQRRSYTGNTDGSVDFSRPVLVTASISYGSNNNNNYIGNGNAKVVQYPLESKDIFATKHTSQLNPSNGRSRGRSLLDPTDIYQSSFSGRTGQPNQLPSGRSGGNLRSQPVEGSYYEWRKIVSDCSVVCGTGIQEVIVQCVSGDTVVNDSLCQGRPRPGHSGYVSCQRRACVRSSSSLLSPGGDGKGSHLWKWIQSILPPKNMSYTNTGRT